MIPFQRAALAVIEGAEGELRRLLASSPELVRARSDDEFQATLLHFCAANGVPDDLQRSPRNAPLICRLLLDAGAEPDARNDAYGGGPNATPLCLTASSWPPFECGVQSELIRILVAGGARPNGLEDDGMPLATALVFGYTDAAETLRDSGARIDNVFFAAGLGDLDLVRSSLDGPAPLGTYAPPLSKTLDPAEVAQEALHFAVTHGRIEVAAHLITRGADVNGRTTGHHREQPLAQARFVKELQMADWLKVHGAREGSEPG